MPLPTIAFLAELAAEVLARHAKRELLGRSTDERSPPGAPLLEPPKDRIDATSAPPDVRLDVVERALKEWKRVVMEPPGLNWQRIDAYIRGPAGLSWPSAALKDSSDSKRYRRNGQFQWCGAFAAWAWGLRLKPEIRKKYLASCYRLDTWTTSGARRVSLEELLPGDIIVMGPSAKLAHIGLCVSPPHFDDGTTSIETVEGNARGIGPDGQKYEGVIRRWRPLSAPDDRVYRVHFGVRPAAEDLK